MTTVAVTENWMLALNAIRDSLKDQRLQDMGDSVYVQSEPFDGKDVRVGVYVTPLNCKKGEGTNERDDRHYGCLVTVIRGGARSRGASPARNTGWTEVIDRLFHNKRLTYFTPRDGDHLLGPCKVEDAAWEDKEIAQRVQQLDAVSRVIRVGIREART